VLLACISWRLPTYTASHRKTAVPQSNNPQHLNHERQICTGFAFWEIQGESFTVTIVVHLVGAVTDRTWFDVSPDEDRERGEWQNITQILKRTAVGGHWGGGVQSVQLFL
jgi:hypothetical protein